MSWTRFSTPGSDVYIFENVGGFIHCCACWLDGDARFTEPAPLRAHMEAHKAAGHGVPKCAWESLAYFEQNPVGYFVR